MELTPSFQVLVSEFQCPFTTPTFSDLLHLGHRLAVVFATTSLRDRADSVGRGSPCWTSQPLSPVFQSRGMVAGPLVSGVDVVAGSRPSTRGSDLAGSRRHTLSQTRPDAARCRDGLRSADLQPRQVVGQLGTRLGSGQPDADISLLVWSLPIACRPVSQSAGARQREKAVQVEKGRLEVSNASRPDPRIVGNCRELAARSAIPRDGRRRLWRTERVVSSAGQYEPHQSRPSQKVVCMHRHRRVNRDGRGRRT
jgi:hypothetical protein